MDYVDLWRISVIMPSSEHTFNEVYEVVEALDNAKKQGKARFTGVSSHDHRWLRIVIDAFPEQMEVVLFPFAAKSKVLPKDDRPGAVKKGDVEVSFPNTSKEAELPKESLFEVVKRNDVGVLGIKPFASNALFKGSGAPSSPYVEEDDRRARLAIRHILGHSAITAPIPGLITRLQVDNAVQAILERRELDREESAELAKAADVAWAKLPPEYSWLKAWEYV
jgi:aryl-alcohol dehydrogenase-like predicted oxidoreductase